MLCATESTIPVRAGANEAFVEHEFSRSRAFLYGVGPQDGILLRAIV